MAFGAGTITDFAGGVGDIFSGIMTGEADQLKAEGYAAEAENYGLAATLAGQNEKFTEESTAIQEAAVQRNYEKASGKTAAEIGGAGFTASGSAIDIMRENAQQGSIAESITTLQGSITEYGEKEQQTSYLNMQAASLAAANSEDKMAGQASLFGDITGGLKIAAGVATLF